MALAAEHICLSTSSRRRMQRMILPAETRTKLKCTDNIAKDKEITSYTEDDEEAKAQY